MKTYKILGLLVMMSLMILSCQETYLEESLTEVELKSGNKGNEKLTGFDEWGINWQAQQFHGYTLNMLLGDHAFAWAPHYKKHVYNGEGLEFWNMLVDEYPYFPYLIPVEIFDSKLTSNWNDALITKDGKYPIPPENWLDTEAWIVFNYSGEVNDKKWSSMRKLVAAKSTDVLLREDTNGDGVINQFDEAGIWVNEDGEEIGLGAIFWDDLMVIQVVNHGDVPAFSFFYQDYNSPNGSGYGKYK